MTYRRKKPDMTGGPWTKSDTKTLQRLLRKYGKKSFKDECRKVLASPGLPDVGRKKHSDSNLFLVYVSLHDGVSLLGLEKACKVLAGHVDMPNGIKKYKWRGLKRLYGQAEKMIRSTPELAALSKALEDLRSGRTQPLTTVTDPTFPSSLAVIPSGTLLVPVLRKKSDP
jgi:hypothetical protein